MDIEQVVSDNMGLAYAQLHRFNLIADDDARSLAFEALFNAAKTYNKGKSTKFSTYATVCIYNSLGMYLRNKQRYKQHFGTVASLDAPLGDSNDGTLADLIASTESLDDYLATKELGEALTKAFRKVISELATDNAKEVVQLWYESECQASQQEIAGVVGISQAQVSRILSMAKHRLKKELEEYRCKK